jgi:hypothetical protein
VVDESLIVLHSIENKISIIIDIFNDENKSISVPLPIFNIDDDGDEKDYSICKKNKFLKKK